MSQLRYIESQGAWLLPAPEGIDCEVLVAGDNNGPHAASLAAAEAVLPSLSALRDRAAAHLDEFVDRKKVAPDSEWFLEGIEFGLNRDAEGGIVLSFSLEGDTYGSWSVTFGLSSGRYWPTELSRRQV